MTIHFNISVDIVNCKLLNVYSTSMDFFFFFFSFLFSFFLFFDKKGYYGMFNASGKVPLLKDLLIISVMTGTKTLEICFINQIGIGSRKQDLTGGIITFDGYELSLLCYKYIKYSVKYQMYSPLIII